MQLSGYIFGRSDLTQNC